MRCGGTRRPSAATNAVGGGSHGVGAVLVSPPLPPRRARHPSVREVEEKQAKAADGWGPRGRETRGGRWYTGRLAVLGRKARRPSCSCRAGVKDGGGLADLY
jgi:hypothetical protein